MTAAGRQMHLGVFVLGTGNHSAGWRYDGAFASHMELPVMQEIARIAERGKFDLLFISDSMAMDPTDHPSFLCRFEPTTLITALAACTTHVGLGATVSTSFSEPFNVARVFGSIDHISGGRAAWNVVTSSNPKAALNFNLDEHIEHELRYARANEFVDVVRGLWDCWDDGAIVADKATGRYVDAEKVRPLNHQGRFFKVRGPINMARCPQGHPVIIQAGGSPSGLELAARTADVVFSVVQELAPAKAAYADLKGRMAKYGRAPDEIAVLPGVMPIVGDSDAEAREILAKLQSWITPTNATTLVASRIGYDVSGYPLDGPVPPPPPALNSRTFPAVLYEMARRENMTLRDLYNLTAAARGHWVVCGTPRGIADTLEEWFVEGAADGFNILPAWFPGGFSDFTDRVVPELQRRRPVPPQLRGNDAARPLRAPARDCFSHARGNGPCLRCRRRLNLVGRHCLPGVIDGAHAGAVVLFIEAPRAIEIRRDFLLPVRAISRGRLAAFRGRGMCRLTLLLQADILRRYCRSARRLTHRLCRPGSVRALVVAFGADLGGASRCLGCAARRRSRLRNLIGSACVGARPRRPGASVLPAKAVLQRGDLLRTRARQRRSAAQRNGGATGQKPLHGCSPIECR